jgi:hypothetical protein
MQKKNLIKSVLAVAFLVGASMFGFTVAHGYGGNGGGGFNDNRCDSVEYGDWGKADFNGFQYRNIVRQHPNFCTLTPGQQSDRSRKISKNDDKGNGNNKPFSNPFRRVLGVKIYAQGTLLRDSSNRIYVVTAGNTLQHIVDLNELAKYFGKKIYNLDDSNFATSTQSAVLGVKIYGEGSLLRGPDHKIYVIVNGKKQYISNLVDLYKYFGHKINNVSTSTLSQF